MTSDIQHPWLCSHGVPTWCELSGGPVCDIWYWRCVDCDEPDCRSDCWDNYKTCLLLSLLDWQIYLTSGYFPSILRSNLSSLDRWKNLSQWSSQAEWYSVNQINWSHCSRSSVHSSMLISCSPQAAGCRPSLANLYPRQQWIYSNQLLAMSKHINPSKV